MKSLHVNYTPIPAQVPRQLAIDILHSHGEIITLNPLVVDYHPIKPPRDAPNDEYYATWYEINQRIQFVPGLGKMGSGKVSFKGCFHDMPWGIQTHMYVPMGIELRHNWHIKGNEPGEPPEPRELGSEAPSSGLYLEERCTIESNPLAMSTVKKELKSASKVMIDRMIKKAELLDAGVLQAMFEDGKLKTVNPADKSGGFAASPPNTNTERWARPQSVSHGSTYSRQSTYSQSSYAGPTQTGTYTSPSQFAAPTNGPPAIAVEMLGDTHFYEPPKVAYPPPPAHTQFELPAEIPDQVQSRWATTQPGGSQTSHSSASRPNSHQYPAQNEPAGAAELLPQHAAQRSPSIGSQGSPPQAYTPYSPQRFARNSNSHQTGP